MRSPWKAISGAEENTRGKTLFERRVSEQKHLQTVTNTALLIAVLIAVLVCWGHGGTITVTLIAFGAALGLGGVLGFLFGVPTVPRAAVSVGRAQSVRVGAAAGTAQTVSVNTAPAPPATPDDSPAPANSEATGAAEQPDAASPALAAAPPPPTSANPPGTEGPPAEAAAAGDANSAAGDDEPVTVPPSAPSNLEQVADWVTKLLLGGGLTQMQRIPPKIWAWSRLVAVGTLASNNSNVRLNEQRIVAEQAFACGLMVYGFVLGFFGGFLITKLQLGKAIAE